MTTQRADLQAQPRTPRPHPHRADAVVLGAEVALVVAAGITGAVLNQRGVPVHAGAPPLFADWLAHLGPGTPGALAVAALMVHRGRYWADRLPWRRLMAVGYLGSLAWALSLALVDGWSRGLAGRLATPPEYLHDVPRATDVAATVADFTGHISALQPSPWTTHVSGHPPGALLVFVGLDRIGLGGGGPAALLCVLVGASAPVSVAVALRALRGESAARAAWPFLVVFPGAVWVGASADGLFAGVVAAGLALLAVGGWHGGAAGGLLLGFAPYLSYGLVGVGALALAVIALLPRHRRRTAVAAVAGAAAVAVTFTAAGFWWPTGYHLVVERYYQGVASERPYGYWVWANLACLVLSAGPAVGPALWRAGAALKRSAGPVRAAVVWLPLLSLLAIVAADLSGLSKAEVERIWLPYAIWLLPAMALLPAVSHRGWLAGQALTALAVNHLLLTNW